MDMVMKKTVQPKKKTAPRTQTVLAPIRCSLAEKKKIQAKAKAAKTNVAEYVRSRALA